MVRPENLDAEEKYIQLEIADLELIITKINDGELKTSAEVNEFYKEKGRNRVYKINYNQLLKSDKKIK